MQRELHGGGEGESGVLKSESIDANVSVGALFRTVGKELATDLVLVGACGAVEGDPDAGAAIAECDEAVWYGGESGRIENSSGGDAQLCSEGCEFWGVWGSVHYNSCVGGGKAVLKGG